MRSSFPAQYPNPRLFASLPNSGSLRNLLRAPILSWKYHTVGFLLRAWILPRIFFDAGKHIRWYWRQRSCWRESFSLAIWTPLQAVVPASAWIELSTAPAKADALANKPLMPSSPHWPSCDIRSVVSPFIINLIWFDITFAKLRLISEFAKLFPFIMRFAIYLE